MNPLPPPTPYHLSGSSLCTSPKHPVSCFEPRLVIHFLHDSIQVSMPCSQIIPPSPSPSESKSLLYTSVSLLLSCIQDYHYHLTKFHIYVFSSVAQSRPILCHPINCSTPGLPVDHQVPEFTQTHVHRVRDAIQPSHPLSSPSPPAPNPSQHQSLFQ